MKTKTTVFYDDADISSFDAVKNYLFETFAEEEGWVTEHDIPDCVVYHEMQEEQRREWEDFRGDLEYLLEKDCYLLTGTCGRWDVSTTSFLLFIYATSFILFRQKR